MQLDFGTITNQIENKGWYKIEKMYKKPLMEKIKSEINSVEPLYSKIQEEAGLGKEAVNSTHHTLLTCPTMIKLLDPNPIHDFLEHYFDGRYILNTMGASSINPHGEYVYTQKIHRDIRSFSGQGRLMLITLVMLDDSTEDNGATWMLSGSHKQGDKPDQEYFYKNAERVLGEQGDLLLFDGNIWHSSGINKTDQPRVITTPAYTKPFIKQALDYPRALGFDYQHIISDQLKQILGYNAMTPNSLEEFYKPKERRFYKSDQG